jgi:hypothetical protein
LLLVVLWLTLLLLLLLLGAGRARAALDGRDGGCDRMSGLNCGPEPVLLLHPALMHVADIS